MPVIYHIPESDCRAITARPSYCGRSWDAQLASAELTASAWGVAYVVVTRSALGELCAGGRIYVSREKDPMRGAPTMLLATVTE